MALKRLLEGNTVSDSTHWVLPLQLLQLSWRVLVQELIEGEETSSDNDLDLVLDTLDADTLGSELVDSLRLAHEHDLELLTVWVVVDVLGQLLVNGVSLHWDVNSDARLEVDDVLAEGVDFGFVGLELLEHLKLGLLGLVVLGLQLDNVFRGALELDLEFFL